MKLDVRHALGFGAASLALLLAAGCTPPPPNADPLAPSGTTTQPTVRPTAPPPETTAPPTAKPSPTAPTSPAPSSSGPSKSEPVAVNALVASDIYPVELKDLPPLTPGSTVYDGTDGYPPFADDNDLYVVVKLPRGVDPIAYVKEYVESAMQKDWKRSHTNLDLERGIISYKLLRGLWVMNVTGATLKDGGVVVISATVG